MTPKAKGPTRSQLMAENGRLRERLKKLAKGDGLRFGDEEWFGLVEYFDPSAIRRIPAPGLQSAAYAMGFVEDVLIIQVRSSESEDDIHGFATYLQSVGLRVPYLVVTDDARFLRLRKVAPDEAAELDAVEIQRIVEEVKHGGETTSTGPGQCPSCGEPGYSPSGCVYCGEGRKLRAGSGPELHGDGLGDSGPQDGEGGGGGRDPDVEGAEEG